MHEPKDARQLFEEWAKLLVSHVEEALEAKDLRKDIQGLRDDLSAFREDFGRFDERLKIIERRPCRNQQVIEHLCNRPTPIKMAFLLIGSLGILIAAITLLIKVL